jgi:hypothetical protein
MLNGEVWLCHTDLFTWHWTIGQQDWVRNLGWFSRLQSLSANSGTGWILFGDAANEPPQRTLYPIVADPSNRRKLFKWDGVSWSHLPGPVVFSAEGVIAGFAGIHTLVNSYVASQQDPWTWKGIQVVEVDPLVAVKVETPPKHTEFPVFFVSNGETGAEINWKRLKDLVPRAQRIKNINGRRKMFLKCAERARGFSHFWVVTGKNYLLDPNVFNFQPDPKKPHHHWIFNARNESNGLEYGHMGVALYSTFSVLATPEDYGLDFTMASPYVSIPWTISEGRFATSPWEAFRTAYRESFKLARMVVERQDPVASSRLDKWIRGNSGPYTKYTTWGALNGTQDALLGKDGRKTVEWDDIAEEFLKQGPGFEFADPTMPNRIKELCQVR